MCTRPKTTDYDEVGRDIENTLLSIKSIARIIDALDEAEIAPLALAYLADRLIDHYDEIYDAWSRIFGRDKYSDQSGERGAALIAATDEAHLSALIDEYRRLHERANEKRIGEKERERRCDEMRTALGKINKYRPVTLRCVLMALDLAAEIEDPDHWPDEAIEGLREIVAREAQP